MDTTTLHLVTRYYAAPFCANINFKKKSVLLIFARVGSIINLDGFGVAAFFLRTDFICPAAFGDFHR